MAWTPSGNIRGPAGPPGAPGTTLPPYPAEPAVLAYDPTIGLYWLPSDGTPPVDPGEPATTLYFDEAVFDAAVYQ